LGTASRIILIGGGCGLLLAGLLRDHGVDVITEEEYRGSNPHHVTREQVGLGCLGGIPHFVDGCILPSLTAGMFLDYDPVVEFERRWHVHYQPEFQRRDTETPDPHVRGTWLG